MSTVPHGAARDDRAKVVLYNPRAVFFTMPLALVAVGSHLDPRRYRVVVIDGRLTADPEAAVAAEAEDAVCLGVTVLTGAPIRDAVAVSRAAKRRRPGLPVVWGGWHPSMFALECLEEPAVDVTVQGQGEETFAEVVDRLAAGLSLDGCAGCSFRAADGTARRNPPRPFADVAGFRRHDFSLIDVEGTFRLKGRRQLDYVSSQGCPFRCAFCADPFVYDRKWSGLPPERIGEEVEELWRRHRFDDLSFQDETFFTYARRVEAVAEELIARRLPITWAATMRADQCERLSEEAFARCRESGMRRVLVGVESGSQEMLDRIRKDIRLDQVFSTAERCRRHGVAAIFPFIIGFPGESDASVAASLAVAKRLRALSPDFSTPIFYFKPYPGSAITVAAERDGYRPPRGLDEWADFDFVGSSGPWVSPAKHQLVERFKFYQRLGWDRPRPWSAPVAALARWRCRHDAYGLPLEKALGEWLWPSAALS